MRANARPYITETKGSHPHENLTVHKGVSIPSLMSSGVKKFFPPANHKASHPTPHSRALIEVRDARSYHPGEQSSASKYLGREPLFTHDLEGLNARHMHPSTAPKS